MPPKRCSGVNQRVKMDVETAGKIECESKWQVGLKEGFDCLVTVWSKGSLTFVCNKLT